MSRSKTLINSSYENIIAEELKSIKDNEIIIKLKAIQASITHKESDVAEIFGISRSTLLRWISNYKNDGIAGCKSKSRGHNPSKLSKEQKNIIKQWIISGKDNSGKQVHWTLKRLMKEILNEFKIEISKTPLWLTMKALGLSLKKPRPEHHKSNKEDQEVFKKNSKYD